MTDQKPLAERMRPKHLDEVLGQEHLVSAGKIIHEIIAKKSPTSLILWGPPGSGKTTLARIVARDTNAEFVELSAVTAGKADVVKVIEYAKRIREKYDAWEHGCGADTMQGNDTFTETYTTQDEGVQQTLTLQSAVRHSGVSGSVQKYRSLTTTGTPNDGTSKYVVNSS